VQPAVATPVTKVDEVATPVTKVDEVAPEVNSVPKSEIKEEPLPVPPRPLSPYPYVMS